MEDKLGKPASAGRGRGERRAEPGKDALIRLVGGWPGPRRGSGKDGSEGTVRGQRGDLLPSGLLLADEVLVAAPLRITDVTSGLMGGEDGRVYVYNGKDITFGDMTGKCKSWTAPCPEEKVRCSCRAGKGGGPRCLVMSTADPGVLTGTVCGQDTVTASVGQGALLRAGLQRLSLWLKSS